MRSTPFLLCAALCVASSALAADFVGPESCKACHPAAYAAWRASKHARAYESLSPQEKKDARCVSCHAPDLRSQQVTGVSCEACHGGGQYYSPEYVMKDPELARLVGLNDPSEKQCRNCHDSSSPSLQPFDFREKLKLIDHWTQEKTSKAAPSDKTGPAKPDETSTPKKKAEAAPSKQTESVKVAVAQMAACPGRLR